MKKLFGLLIVSFLFIACNGDGDYTYEMVREESHSWSSVGVTSIEVDDVNGDIEVAARQDTIITLDVTKRCFGEDSIDAEEHIANIEIATQVSGGILMVDADMPSDQERSYSATLDIRAPDALYLDLLTLNGNVTVRNMVNGATIHSTNGNISMQNFQGNIDGETTNGTIECDMDAFAANETMTLSSGNGNVNVDLPSTVAASFDLRTTNGDITITGFSNISYTTNEPHHKVGTINSGGATIDINATNGNIVLDAK